MLCFVIYMCWFTSNILYSVACYAILRYSTPLDCCIELYNILSPNDQWSGDTAIMVIISTRMISILTKLFIIIVTVSMAISITTTTNNSNNNNDDDDDDDSTDNDNNNDNTIKTHSSICTMQFMYRNVTSHAFVDLKLWIFRIETKLMLLIYTNPVDFTHEGSVIRQDYRCHEIMMKYIMQTLLITKWMNVHPFPAIVFHIILTS